MKNVIFTLLLSLSFMVGAQVTPEATQPTNPAIAPTHRLGLAWWKTRLEAKELQAQSQHDTVLIGDSITHYWDEWAPDLFQHYFGKALNLGFSGDRTEHVLWRIQRIDWNVVAPKRIMLMIGTNNTGYNMNMPPEQTFEGIQAIVKSLRTTCPQAKITVLYIFPRGADGNDPKRQINNAINRMMPQLAEGNKVICRDIASCYFELDGHTLRRDILPDLLHPNKEGYRLWGEAVAKEFMTE
jgi:beta-glucosidase